jgi:hypothetical protein
MNNKSNITKTERIIAHLQRERQPLQLMLQQGVIVVAHKQLINEGEHPTPEEAFIAIMQDIERQINSITFLEEVYKSHIIKMKNGDK